METLFPINFSYSMLQDVHRCEFLWFRKHCQRFVQHGKSPHLIAGTSFASACERVRNEFYVNGKDEEEAVAIGQELIDEMPETGHAIKTNERLKYVLKKYFQRFPLTNEFRPARLANGSAAVEYEFVFDIGIPHPEIPNQNICFKGKLDGLYEQVVAGKTGKRFGIDEKTTGRVSRLPGTKIPDLKKEGYAFETNGQPIAYAWAAEQLGVMIDEYLIRKVPILKDHEDAFELSIPITKHMKDMWSISTFNKINLLVDKYKAWKNSDEKPFIYFDPIFNNACVAYDELCPFAAGCKTKNGEAFIMATHRQIVWDSEHQEETSLEMYKRKLGI